MMAKDKKRRHSIEGPETGKQEGYGGLIALAIVALLIGAVVYSLISGGPAGPPKGESLLEQSKAAVRNTQKESMTFEGSIRVVEQATTLNLPISGEGRIDTVNRRMNLRLNLQPIIDSMGGENLGVVTLDTYVIGDTVYTNIQGDWVKQTSSGIWGTKRFSEKLLEVAGQLDPAIGEKEVVNGRDAIKVSVNPTAGELLDLFNSLQPGALQRVGAPELSNLASGIKSVEMTIWIDSQDLLPVKTSLDVVIETIGLDLVGTGVQRSDLNIEIESNFDFKTPFNIVLPSGAQNAVEL